MYKNDTLLTICQDCYMNMPPTIHTYKNTLQTTVSSDVFVS